MMSKSMLCAELLRELKSSIPEVNSLNEKFRHIEMVKLSEDRALISFHNEPPVPKPRRQPTVSGVSKAFSNSLSIDCGNLGMGPGGMVTNSDSGISSPESPMISPVTKSKKCPSRQYSSQSNIVFRQRAVSETAHGGFPRGILKISSVEEITPRKKTVSFSETNQTLVFNPRCGLDEQAARRKKNEKKRLQKQRKSEEKHLSGDEVDSGIGEETDIKGGKRSARQDSGFVSDDEAVEAM